MHLKRAAESARRGIETGLDRVVSSARLELSRLERSEREMLERRIHGVVDKLDLLAWTLAAHGHLRATALVLSKDLDIRADRIPLSGALAERIRSDAMERSIGVKMTEHEAVEQMRVDHGMGGLDPLDSVGWCPTSGAAARARIGYVYEVDPDAPDPVDERVAYGSRFAPTDRRLENPLIQAARAGDPHVKVTRTARGVSVSVSVPGRKSAAERRRERSRRK